MTAAIGTHALGGCNETTRRRPRALGQPTRARGPSRTAVGIGGAAATSMPTALWAHVGTSERLAEAPPVSGAFWTIVVPLLLFAVSFLSAYGLYRRFSKK